MDSVNQDHVNKQNPFYQLAGEAAGDTIKRMNIKKGGRNCIDTQRIVPSLLSRLRSAGLDKALQDDSLLRSVVTDIEYANEIDGPAKRRSIRENIVELRDWCLNTGEYDSVKFGE